MTKEDIEEQYYKGIEKHCSNCKHRQIHLGIIPVYCELYPNFLLSAALSTCKLTHWIPNKKLYLKKEETVND